MQSLPLAIFEPNELTRHGLQVMISSMERKVKVVGVFGDVPSCDRYLKENAVEVLLLDEVPSRSFEIWTLLERWKNLRPGMSIVVISDTLSVRYVERLFKCGVMGYIHRDDCVLGTLTACLEAVYQKRPYVSSIASGALYRRYAQASDEKLSRVDMDVIHALDRGMNTQETALQLGLDVRTIYRSKRNLRQVLGVKTNEQILDAARRRGLLDSAN